MQKTFLPPSRHKDKERNTSDFIYHVLDTAEKIYVAFNTPAAHKAPYILPFNAVRQDDKIYIHCALEGYKMDCIKAEPCVGFYAHVDVRVLPEKSTTHFQSVYGIGTARIVEDIEEKTLALDALSVRYGANCPVPTPPKVFAFTSVLCIHIEEVSGKQNPA